MADQSSVPIGEYRALDTEGGFVNLAGWTSISVTGTDRQTFLNNFSTNDIKRLRAGTSCEAFFTSVKGKIVGHGLVTCRDVEFVIITVTDQAARLIEHLDRYVIREDVQLHDTTSQKAYVLLGGEKLRDKVATLPACITAPASGLPWVHREAEIAGTPVRCIVWPVFAPRLACLLEVSQEHVTRLTDALVEQGLVGCGEEAFTACRIEAGTPLFGVDFDENNLPQEVSRNAKAISFTKGCYLGQETVARIDALGHVNQEIRGVRFINSVVPSAGLELTRAGTKVGRVTSATFSPRLGAPLALALVRREAHSTGSRLETAVGACEVVALPLEDPAA